MAAVTKEICGRYYSLLEYGTRMPFVKKVASALGESKDKWLRLFYRWSMCSYRGRDLPEETARTIARVMADYNNERYNKVMTKHANDQNDKTTIHRQGIRMR